jgi:hypothetical protein
MPVTGWSRDKASERRELRLNRTKWTHRGITSYDIRLHEECFCPPPGSGPFRVSVRGGKLVKVVYDGQKCDGYWPGRVLSKKNFDMSDLIATVEDVFARAEKVINSPMFLPSSIGPQRQPHKIRYDSEYGFPSLIDVENPPRIADAQWRLVVDEFRLANQ